MQTLLLSLAHTAIPYALAQGYGVGAIDEVGGFMSGVAPSSFGGIAELIGNSAIYFVNAAAFLTIIIAGMLAVVSQDEGRIAKSRKTVVMALMGIVLVNIAYAVANAYYSAFDFDITGSNPTAGANIIATEVLGFISWIEVPVAVLAVITIIVYGIKAVVDYGGEQGMASFKKAILSVLLGIILITVKFALAGAVLTGNPTGIIHPAVRTLMAVVAFAALAAVVVIVIAGIIMVVSVGKEDQYTKAKGIVVRTLIGLFVLVVAAALLALVIQAVLL